MARAQEQNLQKLLGALSEFPAGCRCGDLLLKFKEISNRRNATFFSCLKLARERGWVVVDAGVYSLDSAGSWKIPAPSVEVQLERSRRNQDRLEFLASSREAQLQELRSQMEDLRDWSGGGNGTALASLLRIVSDNGATIPQRLRASSVVLAYKVEPRVSTFVQSFLESVCENDSVLADHRIFAGELLRKCEGTPRIMSPIERPDPSPTVPVDREAEKAALAEEHERRRKHIEEQAIKDKADLEEQWRQFGWSLPQPSS
jgi:hypothetical protein